MPSVQKDGTVAADMRLLRIERPLTAGLLLLAPFLVHATSPAVSVGLKASWNAAPYLLELLETAADENATSYFPLLDRISTGALSGKTTDKELYTSFLALANAEGFLIDPEELASFNLALSIHASAPRIQAHYHHYIENLEPLMGQRYDPACKAWVQWASKQICKLDGEFRDMKIGTERFPNDRRKLPFERVLEIGEDKPVAVLYADIQSEDFMNHHERLKRYAEEGHISYRVRYRPPIEAEEKPVMLSGYGVQLVLKKTDYIVMDDRDVEGSDAKDDAAPVKGKGTSGQQPIGHLEDEQTQDIKPLQGKDLAGLGYKAASFVMNSENPFDTLMRLLQDFPKHSAAIASGEPDEELVKELKDNWEMFIGPGKNLLWINGLQMEYSQVNIFALLEHLRRERKLIKGLTDIGLNSSEAIQVISHKTLSESKTEDKPQRFDYRDTTEGGDVIVWLNDLEKDKRYSDFTTNINMLLRRVYPGQLHPIKKNIHNMVLPMDFTSKDDLTMVAQHLRVLIERKIAIRFGLAPITSTKEQTDQAKTIYHLLEAYGLKAVLAYIETSLDKGDFSEPSKKVLEAVYKHVKLKEGKTALDLEKILVDESLEQRVDKAKQWAERLGTNPPNTILFINGHTIPKNEEWAQTMSQKLQMDVMFAQQYAYQQPVDDSTDFAAAFLEGSAKRRNSHIFPESEVDIKYIDVAATVNANKEVFEKLPKIEADTPDKLSETSIWVVGDFDEEDGYELLQGAVELQKETPGVNLVLVNNPQLTTGKPTLSTLLHQLQQVGFLIPKTLQQVLDEVKLSIGKDEAELPKVENIMEGTVRFSKEETWSYPDHIESGKFWNRAQKILKDTGLAPGQRGLLVNGRIVGPIPQKDKFTAADFRQLLEYEHQARIKPALQAIDELGLAEKITDNLLGLAALTNQIALTLVPGAPAGYFEDTDLSRINILDKITLSDKHSTISTGDKDSATIQILAAIDPASETAQKWVPLLKILSEMKGVHLKIFLNPARLIQELPVKRFYRQVLSTVPEFDKAGRIVEPRARFENIPEIPLLSFSMDVPPSWLVTPKESLHDLDNLKLESLKERLQGTDVEALYELESILIEGHSSDSDGRPPRGTQLVLGTEKNPHFEDTIIMANLGYFQFKANPGLWNLKLKEGRSEEIWNMDYIGTKGPRSKGESEDPQVTLMSFQGATLFPKFSRNLGMEEEDVLEPAIEGKTPVEKAKKWFKKAENFLSDFGGTNTPVEVVPKEQAEINIFSVASGHLYERFLNIMMLSVMKNTDKTVKFWFIENFLSPSFKDFIPIMAKEYNFDYELVTYKWPHWLRAQKEKQREIWGYKILFLDVLFPLDLDKVIFVDADQIVRTDLKELVDHDLGGAVYGFTPMCDSREEIEGFRFWKQGYWKNFLDGLPYHISALYVVDLKKFRQVAAGDKLRQQYHQLSADPASLSNLDQDLPNHMQSVLPIHSLPQDWLWCETWCSDESLKTAKTIDLCNNPMTKEPKLDRARRQVPEWTAYDNEVALLAKRTLKKENGETVGHLTDAVKDEEKKEEEEEEQRRKEAEKASGLLEEAIDMIKDEL